jgi:hypothetical protein
MDRSFDDPRPTYLLVAAIIQDLNRLLTLPEERREATLARQRLVTEYGSLAEARHHARLQAIAAFPLLITTDSSINEGRNSASTAVPGSLDTDPPSSSASSTRWRCASTH